MAPIPQTTTTHQASRTNRCIRRTIPLTPLPLWSRRANHLGRAHPASVLSLWTSRVLGLPPSAHQSTGLDGCGVAFAAESALESDTNMFGPLCPGFYMPR